MWKTFCTLEIYGDPVPKSLVNHGSRIANSPKTKQAMNRRILLIKNYIIKKSLKVIKTKPIALEITYYSKRPKTLQVDSAPTGAIYKTTKPDIDNLTKLLLDCCTQAGLWGDDCQIVHTVIRDMYVPLNQNPKTVIQLWTGDKNETSPFTPSN